MRAGVLIYRLSFMKIYSVDIHDSLSLSITMAVFEIVKFYYTTLFVRLPKVLILFLCYPGRCMWLCCALLYNLLRQQ